MPWNAESATSSMSMLLKSSTKWLAMIHSRTLWIACSASAVLLRCQTDAAAENAAVADLVHEVDGCQEESASVTVVADHRADAGEIRQTNSIKKSGQTADTPSRPYLSPALVLTVVAPVGPPAWSRRPQSRSGATSWPSDRSRRVPRHRGSSGEDALGTHP